MLFWLTAVGGFVVLASVLAAGFYYRLHQNLVRSVSTVIIMVAVWLGILAAREDLRREKLAQPPGQSARSF
jgi:hypothetical protein